MQGHYGTWGIGELYPWDPAVPWDLGQTCHGFNALPYPTHNVPNVLALLGASNGGSVPPPSPALCANPGAMHGSGQMRSFPQP